MWDENTGKQITVLFLSVMGFIGAVIGVIGYLIGRFVGR